MEYEFKTGPIGSYTEFLADTSIRYDKHLRATIPSKQLRYGQYYYARLMTCRPDIANALINTDYDPYYQYQLSEEQHKVIEKLWENSICKFDGFWFE